MIVWTKDKPSEPGWYWLRGSCFTAIQHVRQNPNGRIVSDFGVGPIGVEEFGDFEWSGPIPLPGNPQPLSRFLGEDSTLPDVDGMYR